MKKIVKIYCEGKAGSSDFDVISKIIDGLPVIVNPIGGKRGAKSAIQVYENGTSKSDFKLFFRDRDFDIPIPDTEILTNDSSYVYFSYRTTIENYLIDFNLLNNYSDGKSWSSSNLKFNYYEAAKQIKYFQAMRHTLGKLRVSTDFGTNIVENSGILPEKLSRDYCFEKGYDKIHQSILKTDAWNKESYETQFDFFVNLFSNDFIESDQFLIYFQGKDYMKSLSNLIPGFSSKDYFKYSIANFDYTKFKDLMELRNIIKNEI